jgi:SAM-dependent methyltransferase
MDKRRYFEEIAPRWNGLPAFPGTGEGVVRFVERMALGQARRVLDVGCGTGVLVPHLARVLPAGARTVELDFARQMVRESLQTHGGSGVAGLCADARRLPFATGVFDAVLCFSVLPHIGDAGSLMGELLRVLRPGGSLGICHAMNSAQLNALHAVIGGPVGDDHLAPAAEVGETLRLAGAGSVCAEESPGWYFVSGTKVAS